MEKTLVRRIWNRILGKIARAAPGATSVRPWLHRFRGVQINGTVFIGDDVYIENEYPECVRIEDGAQIALRSTIIAHTRGAAHVVVERNVLIGACTLIIAPVGATLTIGEGAVVGAGSIVTTDIPAQTLVAPERMKTYARVTVPFTMTTDYRDFQKGLRPLTDPQKPKSTK
jgi:acetyltransferase-like isoleucine patch superfamily enzyme